MKIDKFCHTIENISYHLQCMFVQVLFAITISSQNYQLIFYFEIDSDCDINYVLILN